MQVVPVVPWSIARIKRAAAYPAGIFPARRPKRTLRRKLARRRRSHHGDCLEDRVRDRSGDPGGRHARDPRVHEDGDARRGRGRRHGEGDRLRGRAVGLRGRHARRPRVTDKLQLDEPADGVARLTISNPARRGALDHEILDALAALEAYRYPVIAELNGHAIGGGLELALTADVRVAASGVKMGMPPAKLGLIYSHTGSASPTSSTSACWTWRRRSRRTRRCRWRATSG